MNNTVALYLVKKGTNYLISREIWWYLMEREITITAEYLQRALNKETDMQSQTLNDLSECILNLALFQNLYKTWWTSDIDLFASRVSYQVPTYMSWKLDPYNKGKDAFHFL